MQRAIVIPLVAYFFLVLFFLSVNPWEDTIAPMDNLLTNPVWQNVNPFGQEITNQNRSDVIDSVLPQLRSFRDTPFSKRTLLLIISKPLTVFYFFSASEEQGLFWMIFFKLFVAGSGMISLLFFLKRSILAMLFGAITYSFSEFVSSWIFWPHIDVAIWIPWLILAIVAFYRKPKIFRGAYIVVVSYLLTAAWFPSVAAYGFLTAFFTTLCIYTLSSEKNILSLLFSNFAMLLGLIIALFGKSDAISSLRFTSTDNSCYDSIVTNEMLSYDISERYNLTTALSPDHLLNFFYDSGKNGSPETAVYTGVLSIILCFLALPFLLSWRRNRTKDKIICMILWASLGVTICIAWGFFPHSIIRLIPTFSFNPWNRLLVISTFIIALLSGYSIDYILENIGFVKRKILVGIITAVIIGQLFDMRSTWNKYNLSTKHKNFFPVTKSIAYLQENSTRYDYILSDETTYPINGALKNYNIRDWFEHAYRTSHLMQVLNELIPTHKSTHSSSRFTVNDISNINNPLFALLSIKYIISTHPIEELTTRKALYKDEIRENAIPIHQMSSLSLPVYVDSTTLFTDISGEFATFGKPKIASLPISIIIDSKTSGVQIDSIFRRVNLYDNSWSTFLFDQPVVLEGPDTFNVTLVNHSDTAIALWHGKNNSPRLSLSNFEQNTSWSHISLEPNIHIYENMRAPSGPYILDESQENILPLNVQYAHTLEKTIIKVENLKEPGWLVVPDKITRKRIFYDEKDNCLSTSHFMGILPTTKLEPGNTTLVYK